MSATVTPQRQAAILAAITLVVFWPTLSSGFVYDAKLQILTDPFLHDPGNWIDVLSFRVLARDVLDFNRPIHLASLMLDAAIWGTEPFGYHLTSVVLHAANATLLWMVVRDLLAGAGGPSSRTGGPGLDPWRQFVALVSAAAFAVHPVVTEAVCEPTFREDLLVAAFTLGAVALAGRHPPAARDPYRAAACVGCCLAAVASKESGVAAPLVVAAWWRLFRRAEPSGFWRVAVGGGLLAAAAFLAARFLLQPEASVIFGVGPTYPADGVWQTLTQIQPRILALYAQLIVMPVNLCADYGLDSVRHLPLPVAGVVLAAVTGGLWLAVRCDRRVLFGVALAILPLVPVANLVPIYRAAADRYLYLPLAGVACMVACLLESAGTRAGEPRRRAVAACGLAVLVGLAAVNLRRQRVWADSLSLWQDTHRRNPASFTAAHGSAAALRDAGDARLAEWFAREAIRLSGSARGDAWAELALTLDDQGRAREADEALAEAVRIDERLADPDRRVEALALERDEAEQLKAILRRGGVRTP